MDTRFIAIGGGDIKDKTTFKIDEYIANLAKSQSKKERAFGLYLGQASHDFMPAFNSFRKTYTSDFDVKVDVVLTVYNKMDDDKIREKFAKADFIYIGGGDTIFMINEFKKTIIYEELLKAYENGVIICGRSAGAIFMFEDMFTDSFIMNGQGNEYKLYKGIGQIKGLACPHYNLRKNDFDKVNFKQYKKVYAIEDNCAVEFVNGKFSRTISSGGKAFLLSNDKGNIIKEIL